VLISPKSWVAGLPACVKTLSGDFRMEEISLDTPILAALRDTESSMSLTEKKQSPPRFPKRVFTQAAAPAMTELGDRATNGAVIS
jgi:hypothetical protein